MINFFDKVNVFLQPFDTTQIRELKVVRNKYVKFKINGKWNKAEITNFDKYGEPSYKCLEVILENLFEEVKRITAEVPIICKMNDFLYYFPRNFGGKEIYTKDKILVAEKINPIFLKRYSKIDYSTSQFAAFHLGNGSMFLHYEDKSPEKGSAEELLIDIGRLHRYAFIKKLSKEEIQNVFKEYYKELFPEILVIPKVQPSPQPIEEKEARPIIEEAKIKEVEIKKRPRIKRKFVLSEEVKEELISLEKVKEVPYEIVVEAIKNFNPETQDFFGRAAKIDYEKEINRVKDSEKKRDMDYLLYFFMLCSERMGKKEAYLRFKQEIRNLEQT